jgi:hypothetical protein
VLQNLDALFDLSTPAACFGHQMSPYLVKHPSYPALLKRQVQGLLSMDTFFPDMKHGERLDPRWVQTMLLQPRVHATQGGLYLFTPKTQLLRDYVSSLSTNLKRYCLPPRVCGVDEFSITWFLSERGYAWTNIDMSYNVIVLQLFPLFQKRSKILHFVRYKPWLDKTKHLESLYPEQVEPHRLFLKHGCTEFHKAKEEGKNEKV